MKSISMLTDAMHKARKQVELAEMADAQIQEIEQCMRSPSRVVESINAIGADRRAKVYTFIHEQLEEKLLTVQAEREAL